MFEAELKRPDCLNNWNFKNIHDGIMVKESTLNLL